MQVRVVTMRYQEGLQGFPEDALRAATFGKTVLDVREHFFLHGNVPHLALVLQLGDAPAYADAGGFRPRGLDAPDPAEGLTDAQRGVYRALRAWRNETARAEGRRRVAAPARAVPPDAAYLRGALPPVRRRDARRCALRAVLRLVGRRPAVVRLQGDSRRSGPGRGFGLGFEPGETRRQLEQQFRQLHLVQPGQQRPVQPEQQQRLPPCQRLVGYRAPSRPARVPRMRKRTCRGAPASSVRQRRARPLYCSGRG